jgi:hypothetical protein
MPKKQQQQQKKSIYRGNGKRTVKRQFEERYDKKEGKRVYGATVGKLKRRAEGKA